MKKKLFIGIAILLLVFSAYIWVLYPQVERLFNEKVEYIPTRIYSDLIRIHPPQPRKFILDYLKNLGYAYQTQNDQILFTLHPIQYPTYLIPETHATLEGVSKLITLQFDGNELGSA
ncbi:MAG: hypothetical protein HY072_04710, partial [Deltaproteobacteria bacterium]|nr:hypothetical protein [Deltaproteobacteria bacterium]